jgi:trans-aconitate methyltransferase
MRETAAFDGFASTYDAALDRGISLSGESKEYFARRRIEWLSSRLARHACRPRHVLDYGCGTGASAPALLEHLGAASVTGVDVSSESINLARRQQRDGRIRFSTLDQWQPGGEYDLAYCNGVFHHIEPALRARALVSIGRALSVGGYFAFWENNPWNPGTRLVMRRIPFDCDAKLLSAPRARRLLEGAGFDIISTDFLFLFPRALAALRPLETRLTRVPAGAQYLVLCRKRA